jgi:CheY-like chemotaxis protein
MKKILLVNGNETTHHLLTAIIGQEATIIFAHSLEEAEKIVSNNADLDAIFTEIYFGIDFQVEKVIPHLKTIANVPIFAYTARCMNREEERAMRAGAEKFLLMCSNSSSPKVIRDIVAEI